MVRLLALCWLLVLSSDSPPEGGRLEIDLRPVEAQFASSDDVRLWITVRNVSSGCKPLFVDPAISAFVSSRRPSTLVTLTLEDDQGKEIKPEHAFGGQPSRLRVHELFLLRCGASYGQEVRFGRIPWSYSLKPGRYRVQAKVESRVGSFLSKAGRSTELEALWSGSGEAVQEFMKDAEGESPWTEFSVSGPH